VKNSSGYDIIFTTDSACTNLLTWEMENYVASTGEFEAWVTNTSTALSHSSNTTIYMCYGNPSIATFQSTASSVWDSNYKAVYHLKESTNPYNDSTSNANNSTSAFANYPTQATGQIGKGQSYAAASSQGILVPQALATTTATYTVSGWIKVSGSNYSIVYDSRGSVNAGFLLYSINSSGFASHYNDLGVGAAACIATGSTDLRDGNWHYLVGTYDATTCTIYVDGSSAGTGTQANVAGQGTSSGHIGASFDPTYTTDSTDETRVSNIVRSAGWIATEYNNQSAPSSFYTMGSETAFTTISTIGGNSTLGGHQR